MTRPFLEILTRTCKRPTLLAQNVASLACQTDAGWSQSLLVDEVGRGIGWASENMAAYAPHLVGHFVWCLDDDDVCVRPTLVAELRRIVATKHADLIMLRMDHGPRGILPDDAHWGQAPTRGGIGMSAFVARRALWQRCAGALCPGSYESDYELVAELYRHAKLIYWWDVIASRVLQIGLGRPE